MDEAMHPLTLMVVGLYGKVLPNQNGAPLRMHIPWKYGFKSGKSIVRIRFTDRMPRTTLGDYGAARVRLLRERQSDRASPALEPGRARCGCPSFVQNTPTQMFNGYADQVASLYTGLDLTQELLIMGARLWRGLSSGLGRHRQLAPVQARGLPRVPRARRAPRPPPLPRLDAGRSLGARRGSREAAGARNRPHRARCSCSSR